MKQTMKNLILATAALLLPVTTTWAQSEPETVEIGTVAELMAFADRVNNGEATLNAKLTANINMNELYELDLGEFRTIGGSTHIPYEGTFDGQGYTIYSFYYDKETDDNSTGGLFFFIEAKGTVKNLTLKGRIYCSRTILGAIANYNRGTIKNCRVICDFVFYGNTVVYTAGIVQDNQTGGIVDNCEYIGSVEAYQAHNFGGIAASNQGTISNCRSHVVINIQGYGSSFGAIVCGNASYWDDEQEKTIYPGLQNNVYNTDICAKTINVMYGGWPEPLYGIGNYNTETGENGMDLEGMAEGQALGHIVNVEFDDELGFATTDKVVAKPGETVTVSGLPKDGYFLKRVTIYESIYANNADARSEAPEITKPYEATSQGDGTYTFTMPNSNVRLRCDFEPAMVISKQWTTFFPSKAYTKPEGMNVYTITAVDREAATVSTTTLDAIPANTPLLIEVTGELPASFALYEMSLRATAGYDAEHFIGADEPTWLTLDDPSYDYYALSDGQFLLFNGVIDAGRCYLKLSKEGNDEPRALRIVAGDATAITTATANGTSAEIYTLSGQRMKQPVKHGIYIVNGKKTVIK